MSTTTTSITAGERTGRQADSQSVSQAVRQAGDEERNNKTKESKALAVAVVQRVHKHPIIHPSSTALARVDVQPARPIAIIEQIITAIVVVRIMTIGTAGRKR